jgi:hypothetical protein
MPGFGEPAAPAEVADAPANVSVAPELVGVSPSLVPVPSSRCMRDSAARRRADGDCGSIADGQQHCRVEVAEIAKPDGDAVRQRGSFRHCLHFSIPLLHGATRRVRSRTCEVRVGRASASPRALRCSAARVMRRYARFTYASYRVYRLHIVP